MLQDFFEQYLQNNNSLSFQTAQAEFDRLMQNLLCVVTMNDGVWVQQEVTACFQRAEKAAFCSGFAKGACLMGELAALRAAETRAGSPA